MEFEWIQFSYSMDDHAWKFIGPKLHAGNLADSYAKKLSFTGAFVGVCAQDLRGTRLHADFDFFDYKEMDK
ncbi:Beta-xylosidase [compost metagenome]